MGIKITSLLLYADIVFVIYSIYRYLCIYQIYSEGDMEINLQLLQQHNPWWFREEVILDDEKIADYERETHKYVPPILLGCYWYCVWVHLTFGAGIKSLRCPPQLVRRLVGY